MLGKAAQSSATDKFCIKKKFDFCYPGYQSFNILLMVKWDQIFVKELIISNSCWINQVWSRINANL